MPFDTKLFESLSKRVFSRLPNIPADIKSQLQDALRHVFAEFNLVTEEDFRVQKKVLERTQEKLMLLEQKMTEIENRLNIS